MAYNIQISFVSNISTYTNDNIILLIDTMNKLNRYRLINGQISKDVIFRTD